MCTRYLTPETAAVERHWHVGAQNPLRWAHEMFPGYTGVFIRAAPGPAQAPEPAPRAAPRRELVTGQWSLIPWFAKERKLKYPTANARSEELADKASYKHPWARGQRCVIPVQAFYEPCWETGRHIPWRFERPDGAPWGLAGLWNTWTDPASGERVESYTLLTLNADAHPLMARMHKPDPARPPHLQDKRSVVPIALADVDAWLSAPQAQAAALLKLAPPEAFIATPEAPPPRSVRRAATPRADGQSRPTPDHPPGPPPAQAAGQTQAPPRARSPAPAPGLFDDLDPAAPDAGGGPADR